jgi:RNA polymerase sigma-70 factor (sigma-E family)
MQPFPEFGVCQCDEDRMTPAAARLTTAETVGADAALSELYSTHYRACLRLAAVLVDDPSSAEDVVQEAFVNVYRSWHKVRNVDAAPAYLRSAVLNTARSRLRRRQTAEKHPPASARNAPGADDYVLANEHRQLMIEALRALPRRQRECVTLRYYEELSERETADALGLGIGAVKSNTSRGLAALASQMEVSS